MNHDRFSSVTGGVTYFGALLAWASVLTLGEWLALLGFLLALAGFAVNTWLRIATYKMQRREFEARIHQLECDMHDLTPSSTKERKPDVSDN